MGSNKKRLVIIDGMPGSGKTTCANMVSEKLSSWNVSNRCYLELEANHPLMLHGFTFNSLENEEADLFISQIQARFSDFVDMQLNSMHDVTIIESVLFQDAISCCYHMGMNADKLRNFTRSLQEIIAPLNPVLIYFYQVNVEGQWRFICKVRGNEWGSVSLHTDDDFKEAGALWSGSQAFVREIVDYWDIPKLIIENKDYKWDEYAKLVTSFISDNLKES